MEARRYGISLRVLHTIANEWDVELNTRREISYLQASMYYFVYHINKIALYWQEKSTFIMSESKSIDNPRIKIVKSVGAKAQDVKMHWIITKTTMGVVLSSPTKEIFSGTRPKSSSGRFSLSAAWNAITKATEYITWTSLSVSYTGFSGF